MTLAIQQQALVDAAPLTGKLDETSRSATASTLKRMLWQLEGGQVAPAMLPFQLSEIDTHLPSGGLVRGALHDIALSSPESIAAAFGFISALLARKKTKRPLVVLCTPRALARHGRPYGPGLNWWGLDPSRLLLISAGNDKEFLWALEEALRSGATGGVIGLSETKPSFKISRRLHFAAASANAPLFLIHDDNKHSAIESSAALTRWRILPAHAPRDRFGMIERWRWRVILERCRHGRPGHWVLEYDHVAHCFRLASALADPAISRDSPPQRFDKIG